MLLGRIQAGYMSRLIQYHSLLVTLSNLCIPLGLRQRKLKQLGRRLSAAERQTLQIPLLCNVQRNSENTEYALLWYLITGLQ